MIARVDAAVAGARQLADQLKVDLDADIAERSKASSSQIKTGHGARNAISVQTDAYHRHPGPTGATLVPSSHRHRPWLALP